MSEIFNPTASFLALLRVRINEIVENVAPTWSRIVLLDDRDTHFTIESRTLVPEIAYGGFTRRGTVSS